MNQQAGLVHECSQTSLHNRKCEQLALGKLSNLPAGRCTSLKVLENSVTRSLYFAWLSVLFLLKSLKASLLLIANRWKALELASVLTSTSLNR